MIAGNSGHVSPELWLEDSEIRFSRFLVLKIKWIRLLEYECGIGRPSGTFSRSHCYPALPRWAKVARPRGTRFHGSTMGRATTRFLITRNYITQAEIRCDAHHTRENLLPSHLI
jgi:hypothetical protein